VWRSVCICAVAATIASLSLERQAFFRQPWQSDFRRTDHLTKGARGGSDLAPQEPATDQNTGEHDATQTPHAAQAGPWIQLATELVAMIVPVERFVEVMSKGQGEERGAAGQVVFRKTNGSTELIDALD
jgi:hypothetical protein